MCAEQNNNYHGDEAKHKAQFGTCMGMAWKAQRVYPHTKVCLHFIITGRNSAPLHSFLPVLLHSLFSLLLIGRKVCTPTLFPSIVNAGRIYYVEQCNLIPTPKKSISGVRFKPATLHTGSNRALPTWPLLSLPFFANFYRPLPYSNTISPKPSLTLLLVH